jgi:uncharacterized protein YggU (UPF0235/DUF167 family)
VIIKAKIKTGCRNAYIKKLDDFYEIGVSSLPERNKANIEAVKIIAGYFGVSSKDVVIKKGFASKEKVFDVRERLK